jgi:protein-tyrosine phosphatase
VPRRRLGYGPQVIDLHAHVLPGLDDGARTIDESADILALAASEGVTAVAATPHVRHDFPTRPEQMEHGVASLRHELDARGIALTLLPGGELDYEEVAGRTTEELRRFALAGNDRYLLVEFPYVGWPLQLPAEVERLLVAGIVPVLAHPERNSAVAEQPRVLAPMVEAGALVQLTASSVTGGFGRGVRRVAHELLESGLAQLIATDLHAPALGRAGLAAAAAAVSDESLSRWLVQDVPAAIVNDTPVPDRPVPPARRRRRPLRRHRRIP